MAQWAPENYMIDQSATDGGDLVAPGQQTNILKDKGRVS